MHAVYMQYSISVYVVGDALSVCLLFFERAGCFGN